MRRFDFLFFFFSLITIFFIFRQWFINPEIIGGDWPYYHQEFLEEFSLIPLLWAPWQGNGIGNINPLLGLYLFSSLLIVPFVLWLNIPWAVVYKIGWFGLFLFLSLISIRSLLKMVLPKNKNFSLVLSIGSLIYSTNTYILMLVSGGQMGVALSYAVAPLVVAKFIDLSNRIMLAVRVSRLKATLIFSLIFALQIMWDPRIAYLTGITLLLYYFITLLLTNRRRFFWLPIFRFGLLSIAIVALLHAFWILPMIITGDTGIELGSSHVSVGAVEFLSFAQFENSISLLHPNWPENIFGKTYFMRPEFLFIPILAFTSLLFLKKPKSQAPNSKQTQNSKLKTQNNLLISQYPNIVISFFSFLSLLGAFLAKGANPPFGGVYLWLFQNMPGFFFFRDPTKFYLLVILSYSVLIPYSLKSIQGYLKTLDSRMNANFLRILANLFPILFAFYWLFLIHPAWANQLPGTFQKKSVPQEYLELKSFIHHQDNFFRSLWVPRLQRFGYSKMSVEAEPLFSATDAAELKHKLNLPSSLDQLDKLGVQYVIVPYDSLGELFLGDRKYDEKQRQSWEDVLDNIDWLKKIQDGQITIYETPSQKDRFWLSTGDTISYKRLRQDRYTLSFSISEPAELNFSENYHPGWAFVSNHRQFFSEQAEYGLTKFIIETPGTYSGTIFFEPQKYVAWGLIISAIILFGAIYILLTFKS